MSIATAFVRLPPPPLRTCCACRNGFAPGAIMYRARFYEWSLYRGPGIGPYVEHGCTLALKEGDAHHLCQECYERLIKKEEEGGLA